MRIISPIVRTCAVLSLFGTLAYSATPKYDPILGTTRESDATSSGTYEPVLGNPSTSGSVLASTTGGVRSWLELPDVAYMNNRIQVLERNGLFLAIQSAISTNLAAQWGYETFWDQYEDESAVGTKTGAYYDASNDLYTSLSPSSDVTSASGWSSTGQQTVAAANAGDGNTTTVCTVESVGTNWEPGNTITWDAGAGNSFTVIGAALWRVKMVGYMLYWRCQGSNNGSDWTTLQTSAAMADHTGTEKVELSWTNTTAYRYLRVWYEGSVGIGNGTGWFDVAEVEWYVNPVASNITLVSTAQETVAAPTGGTLMLIIEPVEAITMGTDVKTYLSRDGGTTNCEVTLTKADGITPLVGYETWIGDVTFTGATGTSATYKLQSFNTKSFNVKAAAFQVRP